MTRNKTLQEYIDGGAIIEYYDKEDVPIMIVDDGKVSAGFNWEGRPYSIGRIMYEGNPITKARYDKLVKKHEAYLAS